MNGSAFNISVEELRRLCRSALQGGGDWADLYFEREEYTSLILRDSSVSAGVYNIDEGCGIRVLEKEKTGYAYSESLDLKSLEKAARAAGAIAAGGVSAKAGIPRTKILEGRNFYPERGSWGGEDMGRFIDLLNDIDTKTRQLEPRTEKITAVINFSISDILMYNSLGEMCADHRPYWNIIIQAVFSENGRMETSKASRSHMSGTDMLTPDLSLELVKECIQDIDCKFKARRPRGGKMQIVMGAGASGILLHEAMGHSFEADFVRKGQSVFGGKTGKRVCSRDINIVDDGTITANRGACNFDDEGVRGQKTYMVREGILESYLHDRISAKHFGVAPTGNGRRESFRYNPIPRMRATYMENGCDGSCEDLVASVKKGLFVNNFSNGEVKIGEGDFTFYVNSGFLIENGRLTMPVKDINVTGNGPKALMDILAVGEDFKMENGSWTCGKGQNVPVCCGTPSLLINNLIAGGEK